MLRITSSSSVGSEPDLPPLMQGMHLGPDELPPAPPSLSLRRSSSSRLGLQTDPISTGSYTSKLLRQMSYNHEDPVTRARKVYCEGELLEAVQMAKVFEDSKEFVDMPMRCNPEDILDAFFFMPEDQKDDPDCLRLFIAQHFMPPGSDLIPVVPPDFNPEPPLLGLLKDHKHYRKWAGDLNEFWKELTRRVSDDVAHHPQRYSIIRRSLPFVIPGGRFRESYYWDSYWIVLGLLACDMEVTARGLVQNLLDDVSMYGFVPNGGRIYYLNRSQPPLLSDMVVALVQNNPQTDRRFLRSALASLEMEYDWWMTKGEKAITLGTGEKTGAPLVLNRYWTQAKYPRPESFKEDFHNATQANCIWSFFSNIAAGAESGWDFSSRWIRGKEDGSWELYNIACSRVLPVDLNTFLYRMERNMTRLHEFMDQGLAELPPDTPGREWKSDRARFFLHASDVRAEAMERYMWSEEEGMWKDYWIGSRPTGVQEVVSASNYLPLWGSVHCNPMGRGNTTTQAPNGHGRVKKVLESLEASGLIQVGGFRTTNVHSAEQWDMANAWAPIQQMMIEGLDELDDPGAKDLALKLTREWLQSNYLGWVTTGYMFEKYNAVVPGARGEGGEYYPQVGFGCDHRGCDYFPPLMVAAALCCDGCFRTNGVVLHLLKKYGCRL